MYYPGMIEKIRVKIEEKFSGIEPKCDPERNPKNIPHLLWMLSQIEEFGKNKSAKAGRWMGWIMCALEIIGVITNEESRNMIRDDVERGYE